MKCLCITGAAQAGVGAVASLLQQAGMQVPQALTRDVPIDIATWHEQVQASARDTAVTGPDAGIETGSANSEGSFAPIMAPGRLWEQLAGDIFVANLNASLWGWGNIHSTWLLDYWQAFEPRLNFVLVCQTPEQMLASALASDTPISDIDALVQAWQAWHQQMLRFYNRNPQRCLLVNLDDCLQHPAALIERCAGQWKLPLAEPPHLFAQDTPQSPLALHLARQIARSYPQTASLQQELDASVNRLQQAQAPGLRIADDPGMLIADYRALRAQAQQAEQENADHVAQRDVLEQPASRFDQPSGNTAAQFSDSNDVRLKEAEQENELLLLQLHQVQEELENYFLQHQDMQKQLQAMQQRMDRMLVRSPDYIDYAAVEILAADNSGNATWRIKGLDAAGRTFDELKFSTVLQHGMAGLVFSRNEGKSPLLHWPTAAAKLDELTILTIGSRSDIQLRMQVLLELATSDWALLQTLTRLLTGLLAEPASLKAPAAFPAESLRQGLVKLGQFLTDFPQTLRCDQASLKREQVNPDYEHLWLRLDNVAFADQRYSHFEFRLSCAGIRPGQFGNHPKLEFPEDGSKHVLDSWFDESADDFGTKLELRFALPDAMDLGIWKRLSKHDQGFIKALTDRLPAILAYLQSGGTYINRPWTDWQQLTGNIVRISTTNTSPPAKAPEKAKPAKVPAPRHSSESEPSPSDHSGVKPKSAFSGHTDRKPKSASSGHTNEKQKSPLPRHTGAGRYPEELTTDLFAARQTSSSKQSAGALPKGGNPKSSPARDNDGTPKSSPSRHTGDGRHSEQAATIASRVKIKKAATEEKAK